MHLLFGYSGLEEKFYKTDPDCLSAGKHLPDLDLYISTVLPLENKGIRYVNVYCRTAGEAVFEPHCV